MIRRDDSELDGLAAQARSYPPLEVDQIGRLLSAARDGDGAARERLVEHHLRVALDEALVRGDRGLEVLDLYQEGTLATIVAVTEYASRGGAPGGLAAYVARVVGAHLDRALEAAAAERERADALLRDAQLYEIAEVSLRSELGRSATVTELAAALTWPEDRVNVVGAMLNSAREMYDADIVQYLDDEP